MPATLIRGGIDRVLILRVNGDVSDASVLTNVQDIFPGLPAICCLEESAFATWSPQRTLRGYVNNVRVFWIDRDSADVFGCFKTNIFPRSPAVVGTIDTVAVRNTALTVVLSRANPHSRWILRIECDSANRIRTFVVKDWCPGCATVNRLPNS